MLLKKKSKQEKVNRITIEGGDMPSRGGYRMIKAYGDPGTTMDIIVEDSSGQFYDFKTPPSFCCIQPLSILNIIIIVVCFKKKASKQNIGRREGNG